MAGPCNPSIDISRINKLTWPFSRVLPYRDYDAETGLFMNEKTMGFMLEAQPINGANETIVSSLENLMRTKLPREVPVAVHLVSSHLVGQDNDNVVAKTGQRLIDGVVDDLPQSSI